MSAEPKWADLYGADPNFTLGMDASRYLTHQRGECPDGVLCALCVRDTAADEVERLRGRLVDATAQIKRMATEHLAAAERAQVEIERLRKAVWASAEIDRRAGMLAGVEAERDASRTAHAALVAELRALHRPTAAVDGESEYDACVTCFDDHERPAEWPCATAALLDRHAPTTGETP